ncbi:MAG: hypothetical protein VW715_04755 [Rhodospirillales bacterium]
MLGRIYTGRLPTTQANLDLINARIKKVQSDMTILDNQVSAGQIDNRVAAYKRQQLIGEVDELRRVIANSRLSTPSYKTPSDIRTGKPAKKYISYSDSRAFISDYDGPAPINKVPSNWQATELTELDVPDLTVQTGAKTMWPSHWPGKHSPMIMQAVMQTGEINGRQLIDPRTKSMRLNLNMVKSHQDMQVALMLKARFMELLKLVQSDPRFTNGDSSLINMIVSAINRQITDAEQEIQRQRMTQSKGSQQLKDTIADSDLVRYPGQRDTSSGDESPPKAQTPPSPPTIGPSKPAKPPLPALPPMFKVGPSRPTIGPSKPAWASQGPMNATQARRTGNSMALGALQSHDRYKELDAADRVISRTQRQSYLTTERELSLAKKRAGAKIDVTQELKSQPVTRPWSMQVSAPAQDVEQLHIMLDSSLQSIGLTQGMLTQQAHNYIAQLVNSLDSSMRPSDRTEFVVEKIMSEMVNRSALLRDDVRVDVRQNGWPPVNITPAETNSVDNLGGAFLKTKAAMGRLLG